MKFFFLHQTKNNFTSYTDANNNVAVFIPLSRSDLVFRDGNVDISIQRVEELHLHQEERKPIPRTRAETIPLSAITHKAQPSQVKAYLQQNWNKTVGWSGNQDAEVEDYSHQHDRFDSSVSSEWNSSLYMTLVASKKKKKILDDG